MPPRGGADGIGLDAVPVLAQGQDRVVVGRLRVHGGVRVAGAVALRVGQGGQAACVGSSHDAVPGYVRVLGLFQVRVRLSWLTWEAARPVGTGRRVVLHGVIGFSWGCATGDGSCPVAVLA